jgi:hypothetical protein
MSCRRPPSDRLTPSRVKHVLRPLRNKCATLLAYVSSRDQSHSTTGHPIVTTTYGRFNRAKAINSGSHPTMTSAFDRNQPLALLPPPGRASHRNCLDDSFAYTYELARKIYSIRDAFRCIVQVGSGLTPSVMGTRSRERELPSLRALSAAVIGRNMESQFRSITDAKASMDEELTDPITEIYECIPSHLLRCVVLL